MAYIWNRQTPILALPILYFVPHSFPDTPSPLVDEHKYSECPRQQWPAAHAATAARPPQGRSSRSSQLASTRAVGPSTLYLFYLNNTSLPSKDRERHFSKRSDLERHVNAEHLRYLEPGVKFPCPHPACSDHLRGPMKFLQSRSNRTQYSSLELARLKME
jgi:hypothetical protein